MTAIQNNPQVSGLSMIGFDCDVGEDVEWWLPVNVYGVKIGNHVRIGPFTTIQRDTVIGSYVKIMDGCFIPRQTVIGSRCFLGQGVKICNDRHPEAVIRIRTADGWEDRLKGDDDWQLDPVTISNGASLGAGAIVLPGVIIGTDAKIGAGITVTKNVPADATVRKQSWFDTISVGGV